MLVGWRIIGSAATSRAGNPGGNFIRLTASSGLKPCADATEARGGRTRRGISRRVIVGGSACKRRPLEDAANPAELQRPFWPGLRSTASPPDIAWLKILAE